ncbi:MAG: site-2 protease family protein [Gammaproteobacteria bacterium]|nr:site-2 protease family protein [Gammaproteobacteria bacterium]
MPDFDLPLPQLLAVSILPILFAITVHEVAHGWVAKLLGDPTAHRLGRLSLNPIRHVDPMGTVLLPALLLFVSGGRFMFGWAKPVPVTWENLRHPKRDMVLVALAGPVANLLMAVFWGLMAKIATLLPEAQHWAAEPLFYSGAFGVLFNVLLMVFNLLPLPPLDGGRVAVGLLPGPLGWQLSRLEPYGFFILLGLMLSGLLWTVIDPVRQLFTNLVLTLVGLGA